MKKVLEWLQWNFGIGGDWSVKTFIKILGLFLVLTIIILMFRIPEYYKEERAKGLFESSIGFVYKIEPKTTFSQGSNGGQQYIVGYTVFFEYNANGNKYRSSEYFSISRRNKEIISILGNQIGKKELIIKYSSSDPQNGIIAVDEIFKSRSRYPRTDESFELQ